MTTRVLPRAEWPLKLSGTELDTAWPLLPADAQVIVVEDRAGHVVGCWSAIQCWHVEGWGVSAHVQGLGRGKVHYRLIEAMRTFLRARGARAAYTCAVSDEVRALIAKCGGTSLPGTQHMLPVGGD